VNQQSQEHGQEAFSMPVFAQQLIDEKNAEIDHLNEHIQQLQAAGDIVSYAVSSAADSITAEMVSGCACTHVYTEHNMTWHTTQQ